MNFLFFDLQINSNTCKTCVPKMEKIKFEIECSYVGVTVQLGCSLYFCFYDRKTLGEVQYKYFQSSIKSI